jgi:5'-nucleotidase
MKILVTNDDGIKAEGIIKLTEKLSQNNEVYVVAPEKKLHGIGAGVTFEKPLKVEDYPLDVGEKKSYMVYGTTADCVILALDVLIKDFDILVSGINDEPNVGDDVRFSGTVGACIEATFSGINSFGVSIEYSKGKNKFDTAIEFSAYLIDFIKENKMPKGVFLNINVPNAELKKIRGVKFVKLGRRQYLNRVHKITNPYNEDFYWIGGKLIFDKEKDTINSALKKNFIAVTPMSVDTTTYNFLEEMKDKWKITFPC